jgi:hypothetical protein
MNDEFEGMLKEAVMVLLRYCSIIYVEGEKNHRNSESVAQTVSGKRFERSTSLS